MRTDRGFALITVLWLTAALGALALGGLSRVELERMATENRLHQRQAFWAARACLAAAPARGAEGDPRTYRLELGLDLGCEALWVDPDERVHVGTVDSLAWVRATGSPGMAAAVLDWVDADDTPREAGAERKWYEERGRLTPRNGPMRSLGEISAVRGFEDIAPDVLRGVFTMSGDGRIDPNRARIEALGTLSMFTGPQIDRLARLRESRPLEDAEEVMNAAGARLDAEGFRRLASRLVFDRPLRALVIRGWSVRGPRPLQVRLEATLRRNGDSLSVLRAAVAP